MKSDKGIILKAIINIGKFLSMFVLFAIVGFFALFSVNIILPNLIDETGQSITIKYGVVCIIFIILTTLLFIYLHRKRIRKLKNASWWLIGGYAGFLLGNILPVIYMIIKSASSYADPNNIYW